jgi:hypothetical protein
MVVPMGSSADFVVDLLVAGRRPFCPLHGRDAIALP